MNKPTAIEKEGIEALIKNSDRFYVEVLLAMYQDLKRYGYTADNLLVEAIKKLNEK